MPKKILVVDDERFIVRLLQVELERAGFEVVSAEDGKDALVKVDAENPDLVFLDVMMPYWETMDGFAVLKNLRMNPATRELPVILMVARPGNVSAARGWQSDEDRCLYYVQKPFPARVMIPVVNRFLAMKDEPEESPEA
jgi:CheY-like chemotaxis protein